MKPKLLVSGMKALLLSVSAMMTMVSGGQLLKTANFTIQVEIECSEGHVSCEHVEFTVVMAGTGTRQKFHGKTVHTRCVGNRETPCRFQGYRFDSPGATWILYQSGILNIVDEQGDCLLLEQGRWQ